MAEKHEPVVFEDSLGNTISNDPVYRAQQTLESAGVDENSDNSSDLKSENEQLRAQLEELLRSQSAGDGDSGNDSSGDDESPEDSQGDEEEVDLDALDGAQLKELAAERGVDITGLKKVGEVRQALRDAAGE